MSGCPSVFLFVFLSFCLSVCLSFCLSVCLSVCLFVCLPVCMYVCMSVCQNVCLFMSKCINKPVVFNQYRISKLTLSFYSWPQYIAISNCNISAMTFIPVYSSYRNIVKLGFGVPFGMDSFKKCILVWNYMTILMRRRSFFFTINRFGAHKVQMKLMDVTKLLQKSFQVTLLVDFQKCWCIYMNVYGFHT